MLQPAEPPGRAEGTLWKAYLVGASRGGMRAKKAPPASAGGVLRPTVSLGASLRAVGSTEQEAG